MTEPSLVPQSRLSCLFGKTALPCHWVAGRPEAARCAKLVAGRSVPRVDLDRLRELLDARCNGSPACRRLLESHPHLFSQAVVPLARAADARMQAVVMAVEAVVALPAYRQSALMHAPEIARFDPGPRGVFLGFDFHLAGGLPHLIEINTNAGGALLNALLAASVEPPDAQPADAENAFVAMFRAEWALQRGDLPLRTVAIVDDRPEAQFLHPEFLLFQALFRRHGLDARVADAGELAYRDGRLWHGDTAIDLVYNRLTDFMLEEQPHAALRRAYLDGAAVVTPNPRAHALYADKRNLVVLSDAEALRRLGAPEAAAAQLGHSLPATQEVGRDNADFLWQARRQWFFKPAQGYGSRGAYRGAKLTRRVWQEILDGQYVAQAFVPPDECLLCDATASAVLKMDFRHYVYAGASQLVAARLYQGQATNLRTPLGGFAPVRIAG